MRVSRRFASSTLLALSLAGFMALAGCSPGNGGNDAGNGESKTAVGSGHASDSNAAPATAASTSTASGGVMVGQVSTDQARALLEGASHGNAHLDHIFAGPSGLVGAIVTDNNKTKSVVFITSDGKIVFPAGGFTADGESINKSYLVSQNVYISGTDMAKEVSDKGFIVGTKGPIITVWNDPNCYWCHKFFENFAPEVDAGRLRVRVLLVGVIKPDSMAKSVSILLAKDKWKALKADELKFDEKTEEGGAPIAEGKHPDLEAQVQGNAQLMAKAGPVSTPGILFCSKGNAEPSYQNGAPQDVKAFMAALSSDGPSCGDAKKK